ALCITLDAVNHRRRQAGQEVQADEVQSRHAGHDTTVVLWLMVAVDGQFNPRKAGLEACTPDNVRYVEDATVFQQRQAVADADGPRNPRDAGSGEVLWLDADER